MSTNSILCTARRLVLIALAALLPPMLTGCALGGFHSQSNRTTSGAAIAGTAFGGQQPISGGHVYLFESGIGSGTYAAKPKSLLTAASGTTDNPAVADGDGNYYVPTNSGGAFSISGSYTCDAADGNGIQPQVYALAVGGDPQIDSHTNNYITLVAAFGDCDQLSSSSILDMNEITTVATATALQQFANLATGNTATPTGFSTSSTNTSGLKQAMATANNLFDITTGSARSTTPSGGIVPGKLMIDLANVISYCVNSDPSSDSNCSTLSTDATGSNSPIADTLADAIGIAQNPTRNVSTLWMLISGTSAFGSQLTAAPNDWTIALDYTAPALYQPSSVAIDANGDIWLNNTYVSGTSANVIHEFDNAGNLLSGTGYTGTSLNKPISLAIDTDGDIWVASNANNALYKFGANGSYINKYTGGGMNSPNGLTIDKNNHVWVSGFLSSSVNNTLSEFIQGTTNAFSQTTTFASSGSTYGVRNMAFDPSGNLWTANSSTGTVGQVGNTTTVIDSTGALSQGPLNLYGSSSTNASNPYSVASDSQGYMWFACVGATNAGSVAEYSPSYTLLSSNGYRTSNFITTRGVAVDGDGNVWAMSYSSGATLNTTTGLYTTGTNLAKLAGSQATMPGAILSGTAGIKSDQQSLDKAASIAIDSSGNIWSPQIGTTIHVGGSLVEIIGVAAPVITPLASALAQNKLGTRP